MAETKRANSEALAETRTENDEAVARVTERNAAALASVKERNAEALARVDITDADAVAKVRTRNTKNLNDIVAKNADNIAAVQLSNHNALNDIIESNAEAVSNIKRSNVDAIKGIIINVISLLQGMIVASAAANAAISVAWVPGSLPAIILALVALEGAKAVVRNMKFAKGGVATPQGALITANNGEAALNILADGGSWEQAAEAAKKRAEELSKKE